MKSFWFLIGLGISGISFTIAGAKLNDVILSSLGGATLGASISAIIAAWDTEKLFRILSTHLNSKFLSDNSSLKIIRKKWYAYHVTEVDGALCWYHSVVDFSQNPDLNALITETKGHEENYVVTAGVRDQRVITISKRNNSKEPTIVSIYPSMAEAYQKFHVGIRFLKTYSNSNFMSPVVVGFAPFENYKKTGPIHDINIETKLNQFWESEFSKTYRILPKPAK